MWVQNPLKTHVEGVYEISVDELYTKMLSNKCVFVNKQYHRIEANKENTTPGAVLEPTLIANPGPVS